MEKLQVGSARWKIRRRIVNATLLFCAAGLGYLIIYGNDTRLHETIANGMLLLAGSTISSYVFGSVWDDKHNSGLDKYES